jgi:LPS O-antigen subunit length determinant protein (WzzB/FepE family)
MPHQDELNAVNSRPQIGQNQDRYDDEIDLVALAVTLWKGKWIIIGVAAVFFGIAVIASLMMPNMYRSEIVLAPANAESSGGISALAGQFGGLAGLAGINLGGSGGVDKTTLTLEVMKSRAFIADFIRRHELAVPLIAATGWNFDTGWEIDEDLYNEQNKQWVRQVSGRQSVIPSDLELVQAFRKDVLAVSQDVKSQIVLVSVELMSPSEAKKWASWLVEDVNTYMRGRDTAEAAKSIEYLQGQLERTSLAEMKQIFYQLIEEQTKSMMLAQVRDEYALKIIDPAVVPETKTSPKRALICTVAGVLGAIFGVLAVLVLPFIRK